MKSTNEKIEQSTSYTKGPWQLVFGGVASTPDWTVYHGKTFKDALKQRPICFLPETTTKTVEEISANARLIAAAPDLLEACKAIVDCDSAEQDGGGDWGSVEWCEWVGQAIEQAKTAIAKATAQ